MELPGIATTCKDTYSKAENDNSIEELLDFSKDCFIQLDDTLASDRRLLLEGDTKIKKISDNMDDLKRQLDSSLTQGEEQQQQIDKLTDRIIALEAKEEERLKKSQNRKTLLNFIWSITWKLSIVIVVLFAIWSVCKGLL